VVGVLLGAPQAGDIDRQQVLALQHGTQQQMQQCHVYSRDKRLNTDLINLY